MPQFCAAYGCTNSRSVESRQRGMTFHRFPKDPDRRKAWTKAVRRKDFEPTCATVLCSCHFEAEDFDRTGQTIRLRDFVIPSVFSFPGRVKKVRNKAKPTKASTPPVEAEVVPVLVAEVSPSKSSALDHVYALDPDQLKFKVIEAQTRIDELQKQLRNAKDRERRSKRVVKSLLGDLKEKKVITEELQLQLNLYPNT